MVPKENVIGIHLFSVHSTEFKDPPSSSIHPNRSTGAIDKSRISQGDVHAEGTCMYRLGFLIIYSLQNRGFILSLGCLHILEKKYVWFHCQVKDGTLIEEMTIGPLTTDKTPRVPVYWFKLCQLAQVKRCPA